MNHREFRPVFTTAAVVFSLVVTAHAAFNQDLAGNVQIALLTAENIDGTTIFARADGATIHLLGAVESEADKRSAEQIARGVTGVGTVVNELEVVPQGAEQASVEADLATPEAAQNQAGSPAPGRAASETGAAPAGTHGTASSGAAASSSMGHANTDASANAAGGSGTQRAQCVGARYRARLLGISPAQAMPKTTDDELRSQVTRALQNDPLLAGSRITVTNVHNGAVRLEGQAQSIPVHQEALETALQVAGVCKVASEITSGGDASAQGSMQPSSLPPSAAPGTGTPLGIPPSD